MGGKYKVDLLSVYDPDEYIQAAGSDTDRQKLFKDIGESIEQPIVDCGLTVVLMVYAEGITRCARDPRRG